MGKIGCVDVNGAYAFQMKKHMYPVGSPVATHSYNPNTIGFYQVEATVPPDVYDTLGFNPVPCRTDYGLCWPSGTFETFITTPEIEYARKKGCTIDVICGYEFYRLEPLFEGFVDKCQEMELADDGAKKPSIKQIRNSGYGKFGSKQVHKTVVYSKEPVIGMYPMINEITGKVIEGVYTGDEEQTAEYMMPHWAALITAYERLYIMQFMEEAYKRGAHNVYCDTDSIKCDFDVIISMVSDGVIPIGKLYGEFKLEETCNSFIMLGSKCFYGDTDNPDHPLKKAKGLPNDIVNKDTYLDALEAFKKDVPKGKKGKKDAEERGKEFYSVKSVMSIIKENSRVAPVKRKRRITDIRNSFAWQYADGKIYPKGYNIRT